jgi:hypothetical protein
MKAKLCPLLKTLKHIDDREMSITDIRIVLAVWCACGEVRPTGVTAKEIATYSGLTVPELAPRLPTLVEQRYLHEHVPTFGKGTFYRLGSVGGTYIRGVRSASAREG